DPYAPGAAIALNGMLREGARLSDEQQKALSLLDSAFKKAPRIGKKTVLYRGTSEPMKADRLGYIDSKAFLSTSVDREQAENFASLMGGEGFLYEITVPKGLAVLPTS